MLKTKTTFTTDAERNYVAPKDPLVLESLERFMDKKLGFMQHWGPYSEWGFIESWALPDEDRSWVKFDLAPFSSNEEFKRAYIDLYKTFNPVWFDPDAWAKLAKETGFKYLLFTTKHHDGFCMYDTSETDYKITSPECPFHTNKNADVVRALFDSFRAEGLGVNAYFSKADWHSEYYWAPGMERSAFTTRDPTYDTEKYPWLWEQFVKFTHNQLMELCTRYGKIDALWLDAGQVSPHNRRVKQDIRLSELLAKARVHQPGLLCADRTVGGENENYITPEQTVPDEPLLVPWESCVTLGHSFSFGYDDEYKSPLELVRLLCDIVAKGGNLALNIAPRPDGKLPTKGVVSLRGLGAWLAENGYAIYKTRICAPYREGKYAYTQRADLGEVYAIYLPDSEDDVPARFEIPYEGEVSAVYFGGVKLPFERDGSLITIEPEEIKPSLGYVITLKK